MMSEVTRIQYHFSQRDDESWVFYPFFGGGDMVLTPEVFEKHIQPYLVLDSNIANIHRYTESLKIDINHFGTFDGRMSISFYAGKVLEAKIQIGDLNPHNGWLETKDFMLSLPYIVGVEAIYEGDEEGCTPAPSEKLLEVLRSPNYSRSKPTNMGGYMIPVGSPYYGMTTEQLDLIFSGTLIQPENIKHD